MSEWISVKERLPESGIDVIIYDSELNGMYISRLFEDRSGFVGEDYFWNTTHWMPLPEPPK